MHAAVQHFKSEFCIAAKNMHLEVAGRAGPARR
jgi:hypothetical protein